MNIHYLEIVTQDVDTDIAIIERAQGLVFGAPVTALGGARVAKTETGGSIGIRAPMHETEAAATRPYFLTETLAETIEAVRALGAEIALPPTEIPEHGTIAIYFVGDLQYGLWQN